MNLPRKIRFFDDDQVLYRRRMGNQLVAADSAAESIEEINYLQDEIDLLKNEISIGNNMMNFISNKFKIPKYKSPKKGLNLGRNRRNDYIDYGVSGLNRTQKNILVLAGLLTVTWFGSLAYLDSKN
jgi:hypothetical protein